MGAVGNEFKARCVACGTALWQRGWGCHLLDSGWDHSPSLQWQVPPMAKAPLKCNGRLLKPGFQLSGCCTIAKPT